MEEMKNENVYEIAVKSAEEIGQRGLCRWYEILVNGRNRYTGKTKDDYIKKGYTILSGDDCEEFLIAAAERTHRYATGFVVDADKFHYNEE